MNEQERRKIVDGIIRPQTRRAVAEPYPSARRVVLTSSAKLVGVFVLVAAVGMGLYSIENTVTYFNDMEVSSGNRLQAGTIVLSISSNEEFETRVSSIFNSLENGDGGNVGSQEFALDVLTDEESLPLVYNVEGTLDPENPPGCEMLAVDARFGDYNYNGFLADFASEDFSEVGKWQFIVALPVYESTLAPDAECNASIVFSAHLADVPDELKETFEDRKEYSLSLFNWGHSLGAENLVEETPPEFEIPKDPGDGTESLEVELIEVVEPEVVEETPAPTLEEVGAPTDNVGDEEPQVDTEEEATEPEE